MGKGLIAAVLVAAVLPAGAHGRGAILVGPGEAPAVAVDAAGTAHIAYNAALGGSSAGEPLVYCPLPKTAPACASRQILADGGAAEAQPPVVNAGPAPGQIDIVSNRLKALDTPDVVVSSLDGGATFGVSGAVGDINYFSGAFGPDRTVTLADSNHLDGVLVQRGSLTGGPAVGAAKLWPGQARGSNEAVGYYGNRPVVLSGGARDKVGWSLWSGVGDANSASTWSPPKRIVSANYYDLARGPRGLFMLNERFPSDAEMQVRRFTGQSWKLVGRIGPPAARRSGVIGDALAQDAKGRFVAVWYADVDEQIRASASKDGKRWSRPRPLATGVPLVGGDMDAALAPDGTGLAVFGENGGNTIRAVRLDAQRLLRGR